MQIIYFQYSNCLTLLTLLVAVRGSCCPTHWWWFADKSRRDIRFPGCLVGYIMPEAWRINPIQAQEPVTSAKFHRGPVSGACWDVSSRRRNKLCTLFILLLTMALSESWTSLNFVCTPQTHYGLIQMLLALIGLWKRGFFNGPTWQWNKLHRGRYE